MKVAITVWEKRVSPVFDVCREALILEIDKGRVVSTATEALVSVSPTYKIERLVNLGVDTLICGAISEPVSRELEAESVRVIAFVTGEVEEVIQAFLSKTLPNASLYMPGCRGRQTRYCARRGPGRGGNRQRDRARS